MDSYLKIKCELKIIIGNKYLINIFDDRDYSWFFVIVFLEWMKFIVNCDVFILWIVLKW